MIDKKGRFVPKYAPIQIGEKIGLWTILGVGTFIWNQQRWRVCCECGVEKEVASQHLRMGKSTCCIKCAGKKLSERCGLANFRKYRGGGFRVQWIKREAELLYSNQNGICPICNKNLPGLSKCAWDHDHKTGMRRALVHRGCNVFLGFIERDLALLPRVIKYCEKYGIEHGTE
jgi:Recombination endonuclease VII